jgi:VWFA-related protein
MFPAEPYREIHNSRMIHIHCISVLTLLLFASATLCHAIPPDPQTSLTVDRGPIASPDSPPTSNTSGQASPALRGRFTFTQNVDEVVLNVSVFDSSGNIVGNLDQSAFQVFEDSVAQKIISFRREDVPVSLGILIDNSGSMSDKRKAVNKAAIDLVQSSNPDDEVFVVNFSDAAYLDADFTADIGKLNEGLSHIESRGGTALYDAVVASADHEAASSRRHKQVLLVITDGEDNASTTTLESAIRRVQDLSGPVVYAIGLLFGDEDSQHSRRDARRALMELTQQTGGLALFPHSLNDVDGIAAQIASDIRSQYTIGYSSTNPVELGGFRAVNVQAKAKGHGKLTVRTRTGYYPHTDETPASPPVPAN